MGSAVSARTCRDSSSCSKAASRAVRKSTTPVSYLRRFRARAAEGTHAHPEPKAPRRDCQIASATGSIRCAGTTSGTLRPIPTSHRSRRVLLLTNSRFECRSRRRSSWICRRRHAATRKLYGLDEGVASQFGAKCLMARRLVERGVRFVQVWSGETGGGGDWDGHKECDKTMYRWRPRPTSP